MLEECNCDFCTKGCMTDLNFSDAHTLMIEMYFNSDYDYEMSRTGLGGRIYLTGQDFLNLDGEEDYQFFYMIRDNFNREYPWIPSNLDIFATDFTVYRIKE